eukprot:TRINITY_DN505_c0_g1_i1.p1 TRINITY_DN505_c0_g1~~TRINITY_DN505_c0_g1_i1.p1  ORF type:complete len:455 (+),score=51.92 TRINITY_DN505_c0_g1_i1:845-2209(+)
MIYRAKLTFLITSIISNITKPINYYMQRRRSISQSVCGCDNVDYWIDVFVSEIVNGGYLKDRRYCLTKYFNCFVGTRGMDVIKSCTPFKNDVEAISFGRIMVEKKVIAHVLHEHHFENGNYFYKILDYKNIISRDDDQFLDKLSSRLLEDLSEDFSKEYFNQMKDRRCTGYELVNWIMFKTNILDRDTAITAASALHQTGIIFAQDSTEFSEKGRYYFRDCSLEELSFVESTDSRIAYKYHINKENSPIIVFLPPVDKPFNTFVPMLKEYRSYSYFTFDLRGCSNSSGTLNCLDQMNEDFDTFFLRDFEDIKWANRKVYFIAHGLSCLSLLMWISQNPRIQFRIGGVVLHCLWCPSNDRNRKKFSSHVQYANQALQELTRNYTIPCPFPLFMTHMLDDQVTPVQIALSVYERVSSTFNKKIILRDVHSEEHNQDEFIFGDHMRWIRQQHMPIYY